MATVLVVDDDVGIRLVAGLVVTLTGNEVFDASDGLEALEVLSQEHVDLMILDLQLPRMDGWTTLREARREGYDGPVLILSGNGAAKAARELGADDFVSKPFEPEELEAKALKLLRGGPSKAAIPDQRW
jgi:DNA-binding response OmpR family regulator